MGYPQSAPGQIGVAANAAPAPNTTHSVTNDALVSSDKLIARLFNVRNRLLGSVPEQASPTPQQPQNGVLPMASTVLTNIYSAHQLMEEIEQLIG